MATPYWLGTAAKVTQLDTGSIDSVDGTPANNTFIVTIGGKTISVTGDTDVATTAANLVTALNLPTVGYFSVITWTNPSAGTIIGTAATGGIPFTATLTKTGGGTGTVTDFAVTTAASGPNFWNVAPNWSTGSVPVNGDDVFIQDNAINILFGLDNNAVTLASLTIMKSYTGKLGLDYRKFTTDGATSADATEVEYRDTALKIGITKLDIGQDFSTGNPAGSPRIIIDLGTAPSVVVIHDTAATSSEVGRPAIRIKGVNVSNDLFVRSAPGGVGIGVAEPNEVATFRLVSISDTTSSSKVHTGPGVTLTTWTQDGGINVLEHVDSAAVTTVNQNGGTLTVEGAVTLTTVNINQGTANLNNTNGTGNAVVTLNIDNGGIVEARGNNEDRDWTTVNLKRGATMATDSNDVTIGTLNEPTTPYSLKVS